jgi:hypothetical protein
VYSFIGGLDSVAADMNRASVKSNRGIVCDMAQRYPKGFRLNLSRRSVATSIIT